MRGKTASGKFEILNFGMKSGYAFRLIEFQVYPSNDIGGTSAELAATITADKLDTSVDPPISPANPANPDFTQEGLIGTAYFPLTSVSTSGTSFPVSVVNDTYMISQNLILSVIDKVAGSPMDVNWQCRFMAEKVSDTEQANINFKQFSVFDG